MTTRIILNGKVPHRTIPLAPGKIIDYIDLEAAQANGRYELHFLKNGKTAAIIDIHNQTGDELKALVKLQAKEYGRHEFEFHKRPPGKEGE